mmetsp:Transcript_6020/g.21246  ORF Transcript_6020/g.21246 Transcript_6020/m.21246 type:complete len:802 (-) Transcript_6020:512-2917(-)
MPRGSGWARDARDGTTCYVEAEGRVQAKSDWDGLRGGTEGSTSSSTCRKRINRSKERTPEELQKAKEDASVANVLQEDEEYHHDNGTDVLVRLEYMSSVEVKNTMAVMYVGLLASICVLAVFHSVLHREGSKMMVQVGFQYANLAIASCLAMILILCIAFQASKEAALERANKTWDPKQKRFFRMAMGCQGLALVTNATHIASSIISIRRQCSAPFTEIVVMIYVQWVIIFAFMFVFDELAFGHIPLQQEQKVFYSKRSIWARWPHILVFVLAVGTATAMFADVLVKGNNSSGDTWLEVCKVIQEVGSYNCRKANDIFALETAVGVLVAVFFVVFLVYWGISWYRLRDCSWLEHRWKNITLRFLAYHTFTAYIVVLAYVAVNIWSQKGNCERLISLYYGFMGSTIIMTFWTLTFGYMFTPKVDEDYNDHFRQSVLMKFLWTECDIGSEIFWCHDPSTKDIEIDYGPFKSLDTQPVFSFETMIKLMWFSSLIYLDDGNPEEDFQGALKTALSLYNLTHYKVFYEPSLKVRAIVAWSSEDVVVTFRGTKEASNVLADVMLWRTKHPRVPNQGQTFLSRWIMQPLVHYGFLASFLSNRVGDKVVRLVYSLVVATGGRVNVRLTGHSLGGALATLCSYEIARGCGSMLSPDQIICYTYGSPCVGNYYLAREIEAEVPALWNVVNGVDMIALSGKFFGLYTHPGLNVMIDRKGDILVRPLFLEATLKHFFFTLSVTDHLLVNYISTALRICQRYPEAKRAFQYLLNRCPSMSAMFDRFDCTFARMNTNGTVEFFTESDQHTGDDNV